MFGYADESGAPGKAMYSSDYLLYSIVVFKNAHIRDKAEKTIFQLITELNLPPNYEFHCSRNSTHVQNAFVRTLATLDFRFLIAFIHKNDLSRTSSYQRFSSLIVDQIQKFCHSIKIEMDSNPTLYAQLRKRIRERGLTDIHIRERKSKNNYLIQVADYVANICSKSLRYPHKTNPLYDKIADKAINFKLTRPSKK